MRCYEDEVDQVLNENASRLETMPAGVETVPLPGTEAECIRLRSGRKRWPASLRWAVFSLVFTGFLGVIATIAAVLFVDRLERGPILVDGLGQRIAARLQERFGDGQIFRLGETMIEKGENGPELTISSFSVTGSNGELIVAAPKTRVTLDPFALVIGDVTPRRLDVVGLELRMSVMPDGSFAVSAGSAPAVLKAPAPPLAGVHAPDLAPVNDKAPAIEKSITDPVSVIPGSAAPGGLPPVESTPQARSARDAMRPAAEALRQLLALSAGKGSPLGALGQFGIIDGKLIFEDRANGKETVFDGLQLHLERASGQAKLRLAVNGPNGRWEMSVAAAEENQNRDGALRSLDVDFSNLSLDEIRLFSGIRELPFDTDMPLNIKFRIGSDAGGEFRMAEGSFALGAGFLSFRDPDQEPVLVDRVSGAFHWEDSTRRFIIDSARVESSDAKFLLSGVLLPPQSNNGLWAFNLANIGPGQIGAERPGQASLAISKFEFAAIIDPQAKSFNAERFILNGPLVNLTGNASFSMTPEGRRFQLKMSSPSMPALSALRLWPSASGATIRAWLEQHLKSGVIDNGFLELDFGEEAFAALHARTALPDAALRIDFDVREASLSYLAGVSAAKGLSGSGRVTGKQTNFSITQGHIDGDGKQIEISGGKFTLINMAPLASPASVTVNLAGQADTLAAVLNEPGLKPHAALILDPSTLKGRVEGRLTVDFKLGRNAGAADPRIRAQGNATNVSIDRLMGKERLESASIQFTIDGKDLSAKGSGKMFGAPASFSFDKVGAGELNAIMTVVLDDQARQKLGWSTGSRLAGPVAMKISGPLNKSDSLQGNVEFDLTKAVIADIIPGLGKPAGRAAKASFTLANRTEGTILQNFIYQTGFTSLRGSIDLDKKGVFTGAALSSVKLSPSDELTADISTVAPGNLKVALRGASIDLRPFIQAMTSPQNPVEPASSETAAGRMEVEVQSKLATGYNRQAFADFSLKMTRDRGRFQRFELTARNGRTNVNGRLVPGTSRLEVTAGDGGAVMSFMDLYRRMEGGQLSLTADVSAKQFDGVLNVQDFVLRDEPALKRLVAEGVARTDAAGRTQIDPSLVQFERLRLNFTKTDGRIQLHDGVINGSAIGTTLEGVVDFPLDQVSMKGTFVPAYGLNNMFAKIPLFGPILGGGRNEGLVGVNYTVTGKASAPLLNVNPLSAIAPGFLRKIFGAIGATDSAGAPPPRPQMPLSLAPVVR